MRSANNNKFKNTINLLLCNKKTKLGIADSLIKLNLIDTVDSRYKKF